MSFGTCSCTPVAPDPPHHGGGIDIDRDCPQHGKFITTGDMLVERAPRAFGALVPTGGTNSRWAVLKRPRLHAIAAIAWALTVVPTLLWWRQSVLWVAFMSIYAIVVSHWSAYEAAKAAKEAGS